MFNILTMDKHYFYIPELNEHNQETLLQGEEFCHLNRVLRLAGHDVVYLLNGKGFIFKGEIKHIKKEYAEIKILKNTFIKKVKKIILLQALIKKDAMELVIEKAQELGVYSLQPVVAERSVVRIKDKDRAEKRLSRWDKVAVKAMKQSGNPYLLEIESPLDFNVVLDKYKQKKEKFICKIGEKDVSKNIEGDVVILVGPEGDFTKEEYQLAEGSGFKSISFGTARLRSETAATVAIALFNYST